MKNSLNRSFFNLFISCVILCTNWSFKTFSQELSPIQPKYQSYVSTSTPQLKWNALSGASSYIVSISTDVNFSNIVQQSPILTTTSWTVSPLPTNTYFWKITGTNSNGIYESTTSSFTYWLPSNSANLSLWLDANIGIVPDVNGRVSEWHDSSPNNFVLAQTDPNKRPYISTNSLNGLPSLQFLGGQVLSGGDILDLGTNSRAMFFVSKMTGTSQALFGKSINVVTPGRYGFFRISANSYFIYQEATDNHLIVPATSNNFSLYRLENNRNLSLNKFNLNNNTLGQQVINPTYNFNSTFRFLLGAYNNSTDLGEQFFLNGNINEVVFVDTYNPSEISNVESYLRYKYAPPVDLGKDTSINNFCSITLTAPAGYTNLLWSTGETSSSISVSNTGSYWLSGKDIFGFTSKDTIQVNFPEILEIVDSNFCYQTSTIWDTGLDNSFIFNWNNGLNTPAISINTQGAYHVQVTDGLGCIKYSDTINFSIDNYELTASLGNDTTVCSGNYVELVNNAAETVSYQWQGNTTSGQPSSLQITSTGDYWLQSTNTNGCVAQDTIHVIVSGTAPVATFVGQNRCLGVANAFTDGSAGVAGDPVTSWSWDFGDGLGTSNTQNPSYTYATPGIYTVELYALSQGGCGSYHTEQVEIYTPPTAAYTHTGSCSDQVMQFTNQSTPGDALINQYAWNFGQPSLGAMNVSSVQNPYRSFPTGGTFPMTLTVTDAHLCTDDTVMQITVNATPVIDVFAADACTGATVQFTNNTVVQAPATYLWNFGDNTTSILPLPSKQYPTEGLKTITVKVTAANGCFTADTIQMTVHTVPVASFDLGPHCKGAYTEVQSTSTISSGSIADLFWVVNLTDTLYGDTTGYEIMNLIQQQVQLFITSDFGCTDDQNMFFNPEGAIGASFTTPSTIVACGDTVSFVNTSLGATAYAWSFGNDSVSTVSNPSIVYDCSYQDSSVMVTLIASNSLGCIDTSFTFLWVGEYAVDLQVDNIYFQANGSNAILGAELKNMGTAPLTSIDLNVFSEAGFVMNEVWTGNLLPNQTEIYVFTNQPAMTLSAEDEILSFYCVQGTGYANTQVEPDLTNNEVCKNIESSEVILKPLYPNPTGSTITMSLIVPESAEVEADFVDDQGRVVKQLIYPFTLESGEYTYVFDLAQVANGTYVLRFTVNGKTELHRLVVLK
ncbi:MAG: hypothetical protein RI922_1329 [Bacteroidota bacterium]|jgi:PKD repeat protein